MNDVSGRLLAGEAVSIDGVNLSLGRGAARVHILKDIGLHIGRGEAVALLGPSGSGKSTLLMVMTGLERPDSGSIIVAGQNFRRLDEDRLARFRGRNIGIVFQAFHLIPTMTALENVAVPLELAGIADAKAIAERELAAVGLTERAWHYPAELSGGEQQRVALARALAPDPAIIVADEPTGNLDEANENIVLEIFRELHRSGHTILMVTHDPDIARQADRRIELAHGHLHFDTAQHGPGHPLACPLVNTADCCTNVSTDDEIRFDHLLEQIWICGEEGKPALVDVLRATGPAGNLPVLPDEPASRVLNRMTELQLVELRDSQVQLTPGGSRRARDVVRRHRLAERLFTDTFAIEDSEAHNQACKFEHIISPELDQRICTFLGHPKTCPHGNPIPPGACCNGKPPK
jgi:putative ABC transport system ATP-binding protein